MITLLMGFVKEDGLAARMGNKGSPDFEGYELLMKNISGKRIPGETKLNDYGVDGFYQHLKSPMQYSENMQTKCDMHYISSKLNTRLQQYMVLK